MIVRLVSRPQFIALPPEMGTPHADQLLGPDAQKLIETAGRICYDSFGGKARSSGAFAQHLQEVGHLNPTYHANFSFFISGVSRGFSHEFVRHHVGCSPSQRSTRYCNESDSPWIPHPLLKEIFSIERETYVVEGSTADPMKIGSLEDEWDGVIQIAQRFYRRAVDRGERLLEGRGVDKLTARKQARGAARGALGNALETEMIWTGNVEAIRHAIVMRGNGAADAEIRAVAVRLLEIMVAELPVYFNDFVVSPSPDGIGEIITKIEAVKKS